MFALLSGWRLVALGLVAAAAWYAYGWGLTVINNYGSMAAEIQQLKRDKILIGTRVDSYKTLLARRDAAIEASACKVKIQGWIKNPDQIPTKWDPFNQLQPKK